MLNGFSVLIKNKRSPKTGIFLLFLAALCFFPACASHDKGTRYEAPQKGTLYDWMGEGMTGPARIVINLTTQRLEVFLGGQFAGWAIVATGKEGHATPAKDYRIMEKIEDKHSTLYGVIVDYEGNMVNENADIRVDKPPLGGKFLNAPMPYWMRLTSGGIGMHAGFIPDPGNPASHGCIRLPSEFAPLLFSSVKVGTPVKIVR